MTSILANIGAAVAEIAGCFGFWAWLRLDRCPSWLIPGMGSLALFAYLLEADVGHAHDHWPDSDVGETDARAEQPRAAGPGNRVVLAGNRPAWQPVRRVLHLGSQKPKTSSGHSLITGESITGAPSWTSGGTTPFALSLMTRAAAGPPPDAAPGRRERRDIGWTNVRCA